MAVKKYDKLKQIAVGIETDDFIYLKTNGINRSDFMRQAIKTHQEGKWKYRFL